MTKKCTCPVRQPLLLQKQGNENDARPKGPYLCHLLIMKTKSFRIMLGTGITRNTGKLVLGIMYPHKNEKITRD